MVQSIIAEEERGNGGVMMFIFPSNMWGLGPRIGCFKKVINIMRHFGQICVNCPTKVLTRMVTMIVAIPMTGITFGDRYYI
jgi:hypothetical protein